MRFAIPSISFLSLVLNSLPILSPILCSSKDSGSFAKFCPGFGLLIYCEKLGPYDFSYFLGFFAIFFKSSTNFFLSFLYDFKLSIKPSCDIDFANTLYSFASFVAHTLGKSFLNILGPSATSCSDSFVGFLGAGFFLLISTIAVQSSSLVIVSPEPASLNLLK